MAYLNTCKFGVSCLLNLPRVTSRFRSRKMFREFIFTSNQLTLPSLGSHLYCSSQNQPKESKTLKEESKIITSTETIGKENANEITRTSNKAMLPGYPEPVLQPPANNNKDSEMLPSRFLRFFFGRYSRYLKRFQQSLEREMPGTFNMFRIFSVGVKLFAIDFKDFIKILIKLSSSSVSVNNLNRHELELYQQMPRDMIRVFPVIIVSAIPFGQNIAFPIGYWFPRQLLCRHFWSLEQRHNFAIFYLKKRLIYARPVFRCLQSALYAVKEEPLHERCKTVFFKLGSGVHPTNDEVLALLPLFQMAPYDMQALSTIHVSHLLHMYGRSSLWLMRRRRLKDIAEFLKCHDEALISEGVATLTTEQLRSSLFLRGINPTHMNATKMVNFLHNWLDLSSHIGRGYSSLLLHLPIFLAYNEPSNLILRFSK